MSCSLLPVPAVRRRRQGTASGSELQRTDSGSELQLTASGSEPQLTASGRYLQLTARPACASYPEFLLRLKALFPLLPVAADCQWQRAATYCQRQRAAAYSQRQ